jgi:YhcH/YjgK/YiaL family protein
MICDSITRYAGYGFGPVWGEVMRFILAEGANFNPGDTEQVAGCPVRVAKRRTHPEGRGRYETHRDICDLQIVLRGAEWHYVAPVEWLTPDGAYDQDNAVQFHHPLPPGREAARLTLVPGLFVLLFPWDGHMPRMSVECRPEEIVKLVVVIPLDKLLLGG